MNNIGKYQSEQARKGIEMKHGLVKAEDHKKELFKTKAVNASKVKIWKNGNETGDHQCTGYSFRYL